MPRLPGVTIEDDEYTLEPEVRWGDDGQRLSGREKAKLTVDNREKAKLTVERAARRFRRPKRVVVASHVLTVRVCGLDDLPQLAAPPSRRIRMGRYGLDLRCNASQGDGGWAWVGVARDEIDQVGIWDPRVL